MNSIAKLIKLTAFVVFKFAADLLNSQLVRPLVSQLEKYIDSQLARFLNSQLARYLFRVTPGTVAESKGGLGFHDTCMLM